MNLRQHLGRLRNMRGYRAAITIQYAAPQVEKSHAIHCIISVTNTGDQVWRAGGGYPVRLSYHWRRGSESREGVRILLPGDIAPGERAVFDCQVPAPTEEGDFVLEFDLVRECVGWFKDHGSPVAAVERPVRDYDYQVSYRQSDLEKDYWTIVGPTTREHYEHLGREKRQTLIDLGMTPRSRVLDVGCGTGQLTEALVDYLSDDAAYVGTDIAAEAVAFCQAKFTRPNFSFRRNDMSSVDVDGRQFDIIFLASVFTHMYPPEIKAMLIDLKRALAPGGLIMADFFTSPHAAPVAGSRSKVEIREDYLMDLFTQTGLRHELQGTIVQPANGKRLGFVFRHPS